MSIHMSTPTVQSYYALETYEKNLKSSQVGLKDEDLNEFWLNNNGTFTPKTSILKRIIRWIQNWLYDKTLRDIWVVFERAALDCNISTNFPLKTLKGKELKIAADFVNARLQRLEFVTRFFLSRKDDFDRWIRHNGEKRNFLKSLIVNYQTDHAHPKMKQQTETALQKLEELYLPSVKLNNLGGKSLEHSFTTTSQNNTWKDKVLHYVQDLKNSILSDSIDPTFKILASKDGEEFELDTIFCETDGHTDNIQASHLTLIRQKFLSEFNSPRIVKEISTRINKELQETEDTSLMNYLIDGVKRTERLNHKDAANYISEYFFEGPKITDEGVVYLLQQAGILN